MKKLLFLLCWSAVASAQNPADTIGELLNNWHKAAAEARFDDYFEALDEQSVFIGTDATENWDKPAFMKFAKPYFDRGKAWSFSKLERHIYLSKDGKTAWFDELLLTQMKICRGSGVLLKTKKGWKIKHYVLSMTVPNDNVDEVVKIKSLLEDKEIERLRAK